MIESREPGAHRRRPCRPVIKRACAEAGRDGGGEKDGRGARTSIVGGQDEDNAAAECGVETKFVKDPAESWLHAIGWRDHGESLRTGATGTFGQRRIYSLARGDGLGVRSSPTTIATSTSCVRHAHESVTSRMKCLDPEPSAVSDTGDRGVCSRRASQLRCRTSHEVGHEGTNPRGSECGHFAATPA
jgi:hypothetical protein